MMFCRGNFETVVSSQRQVSQKLIVSRAGQDTTDTEALNWLEVGGLFRSAGETDFEANVGMYARERKSSARVPDLTWIVQYLKESRKRWLQ